MKSGQIKLLFILLFGYFIGYGWAPLVLLAGIVLRYPARFIGYELDTRDKLAYFSLGISICGLFTVILFFLSLFGLGLWATFILTTIYALWSLFIFVLLAAL